MHTKKITAAVLFLSFAFVSLASAQLSKDALLKEGISEEEVGNTITYFYLNHDKAKLISSLKVILSDSSFLNDQMHFLPVAHFFATVAHRDPAYRLEFEALKDKYTGAQKEAIEKIIAESYNLYSPDARQSPAALDYLWSEFCATGDSLPVHKIIEVLDYQKPTSGKLTDADVNNALVFGAARWSLTSNAIQHKKVYEILKTELDMATGKKKENIREIIAAADKEISQAK